MTDTVKAKVFRKEEETPSIGRLFVFSVSILLFAANFLVFTVYFFVWLFEFQPKWIVLEFPPHDALILSGIGLLLFGFIIKMLYSKGRRNSYLALMITEDTFTYEDGTKKVTLHLPCTIQQGVNYFLLDDGTTQLALQCDKKSDEYLLQFLSNVLN